MNNTVRDDGIITTDHVSSNDIHVNLNTMNDAVDKHVVTRTEVSVEKHEKFVNKKEYLNEHTCNELCKCIHSNKSCPTCTCRNSACGNKVLINIQLNKAHYYCSQHMRCGLNIEPKGPCKGCLNTYQ